MSLSSEQCTTDVANDARDCDPQLQAVLLAHEQSLAHTEYTVAVEECRWPSQIQVPLPVPFVDDRGTIQNLLLNGCKSVASITSKRGSVRANHFHREDLHYAEIAYGRVLYFERAVGSKEIPEPVEFTAGQMFFTPPMREHAMLFAEDTKIYTFAKRVRTHEEHEKDVVRVDFITPAIAAEYVR